MNRFNQKSSGKLSVPFNSITTSWADETIQSKIKRQVIHSIILFIVYWFKNSHRPEPTYSCSQNSYTHQTHTLTHTHLHRYIKILSNCRYVHKYRINMMSEGMAITAKMQVKYKSTRSGKSGERVNTATKSTALPPTD